MRCAKQNLLSAVIACLLCLGNSEDTADETKVSESFIGGNFLQSVMNRIQIKRVEQALPSLLAGQFFKTGDNAATKHNRPDDQTLDEIYLPTPVPDDFFMQENDNHDAENIPPLSREELIALYRAAIAKGTGIDLTNLPMLNLEDDERSPQEHEIGNLQSLSDVVSPSEQGTLPGYYYYFYPIENLTNSQEYGDILNRTAGMKMPHMTTNALMTAMMKKPGLMIKTPNNGQKNVEPLFIAMASFVGMAMMFILSILFMPKFGNTRSRDVAALKTAPDEILTLSSVIGEVIEGKDCSSRIACEVGMRLGKKPIRILEILLPANLARQIMKIRKSAERKEKCHFITCKLPEKRIKNKHKNNIKAKPSQSLKPSKQVKA